MIIDRPTKVSESKPVNGIPTRNITKNRLRRGVIENHGKDESGKPLIIATLKQRPDSYFPKQAAWGIESELLSALGFWGVSHICLHLNSGIKMMVLREHLKAREGREKLGITTYRDRDRSCEFTLIPDSVWEKSDLSEDAQVEAIKKAMGFKK